MSNNYLVHHGVKGMKWGVRKDEWDTFSRRKKGRLRRKFKRDVSKKSTYLGDKYDVDGDRDYKISVGKAAMKKSRKDALSPLKTGAKFALPGLGIIALSYATTRKGLKFTPNDRGRKVAGAISKAGIKLNDALDKYNRLSPTKKNIIENSVALASLTPAVVATYLRARDKKDEEKEKKMSHYDANSDYLIHYGVKGMKWGVRKEKWQRMSKKDRIGQKKKFMDDVRAKYADSRYNIEGSSEYKRAVNATVSNRNKKDTILGALMTPVGLAIAVSPALLLIGAKYYKKVKTKPVADLAAKVEKARMSGKLYNYDDIRKAAQVKLLNEPMKLLTAR